MIEDFTPYLEYGFPALVAIWFMFRLEKLLKYQSEMLFKMELAIQHLLSRKILIGKKDGIE